MRHDVAPKVGGSRIAVLKDDGVALALVYIGHLPALYGD